MAIPLSLVARLEEFPRSALERVGPQDVVQYRDEILPLIHVSRRCARRPHAGTRAASVRGGDAEHRSGGQGRAIPSRSWSMPASGQRVGLVVDRILDIVEETLVSRSPANRPGVLFTAVIQGRVTEFLDVEGILRSADPDLRRTAPDRSRAEA